jgi:thymidylate synthase (FAD)
MKIVEQGFKILSPLHHVEKSCAAYADGCACAEACGNLKASFEDEARLIELAGRTAHKSEGKAASDSYDKFIRGLIKQGHEAVIEFGSMTVKFVTDRGVSHELVRHRMCSFVQESTRYCNYDHDKFGRELTVIKPSAWDAWSESQQDWWKGSLEYAELNYLEMVQDDMQPQEARSVLPNSLKTEVVVRANFREWRHIFRLRAISKAAHPDMRALMIPLYEQCRSLLPCCFDMGKPE